MTEIKTQYTSPGHLLIRKAIQQHELSAQDTNMSQEYRNNENFIAVGLRIADKILLDNLSDEPFQVPFDEDVLTILGRPCFACTTLATLLRMEGKNIPMKAEAEQAHVIHYLLNLYLKHGNNWNTVAEQKFKELLPKST